MSEDQSQMTDTEKPRPTGDHQPSTKWDPDRVARKADQRGQERSYNPERMRADKARRVGDPLPPSEWDPERLASEAGIASPDGTGSPGAGFLLALRDAVADLFSRSGSEPPRSESWWHEHVHDIAERAIPDDPYSCWKVFADLCLWEESVHMEAIEGNEYVPFQDLCIVALYEAAHRLSWVLCQTMEARTRSAM